jgi:integrase
MLVNEWTETLWSVLNVREKTLRDYKHLYKRHLQALIGDLEIGLVNSKDLQVKLLSLPPQTARHTLMLAKTIWREAENYGVATHNPLSKLKTAPIQITPKKFLTWDEVDSLKWGRYDNQIRFLALHGLRWSEAAALTIGDIKDGSVLISRSVYGACKSKSSVRRVPSRKESRKPISI